MLNKLSCVGGLGLGLVSRAAGAIPDTTREARLFQLLHDYRADRAAGNGRLRCLLARPRAAATATCDFLRLPRLAVTPTATHDGAAIRQALLPAWSPRRLVPHAAVLALPETADEYLLGASKQTLRRKVRKAQRLGITWRRVDDPVERWELVRIGNEWERNNPNAQYRNPEPDNSDLPDFGLWLLACSSDGRPLVLSVTPVDGQWAMLHYFRGIAAGEEQSLARYYLMTVLVEHLVAAGVRYLFNSGTPIRITNGLRHYQRMVGFRMYRLKVAGPGRPGPYPAERRPAPVASRVGSSSM